MVSTGQGTVDFGNVETSGYGDVLLNFNVNSPDGNGEALSSDDLGSVTVPADNRGEHVMARKYKVNFTYARYRHGIDANTGKVFFQEVEKIEDYTGMRVVSFNIVCKCFEDGACKSPNACPQTD